MFMPRRIENICQNIPEIILLALETNNHPNNMNKALTVLFLCCPIMIYCQTWQQVASMPSGKHHPVTFSLQGKGYAITGTNPSELPTDDVYQYNPTTNQWTTLSDFPGAARSFAIGQAYNGKGYLGFGASLTSYFNDIWEFDPNTENWTLLTTCDCSGRRHPAFIIKDDKIYVGLGDDATGDLDDWHIYDMATDNWTQAPDIPGSGRHHPFMFPAGDDIYAGMGHSGALIYGDWYKFNIQTESWETMSDFPGEHRVAGTQFGHQGKGYVLSGDGSNHSFMPTGEFWEYEPSTDSWTELDPHPGISRWAPGSFVINGAVYFIGGQNRVTGVIMNDMWTYQLTSPTSTADLDASNSIVVFPNPASDFITIKTELNEQFNVTVQSSTGQLVHQTTGQLNNLSVDVSAFEAGIYLVSIESATQLIKKKLIIQ